VSDSGTFPRGPHRMSDPGVRVRVMLAAAALLATTWGSIAALGKSDCAAFTTRETRELAALPVPPSCVQNVIPPGGNPIDKLQQNLDASPGVSP
jgi:hypothetical protein